jgi:hypothetical protein
MTLSTPLFSRPPSSRCTPFSPLLGEVRSLQIPHSSDIIAAYSNETERCSICTGTQNILTASHSIGIAAHSRNIQSHSADIKQRVRHRYRGKFKTDVAKLNANMRVQNLLAPIPSNRTCGEVRQKIKITFIKNVLKLLQVIRLTFVGVVVMLE